MNQIDTVVIGGGQAGLATSYYLRQLEREHIVLEQAGQAANPWRTERWDSFTMVTPNWSLRMPGTIHGDGEDRDGFMTRDDIVAFFDDYIARFDLPVRFDARVSSVQLHDDGRYLVSGPHLEMLAANVVIATGFFQHPRIPLASSLLDPSITQLHSSQYRNPGALPEGAVLVVGSAQAGAQIAEELNQPGRRVYLSVGGAGRVPRRYRGHDIIAWLDQVGLFDLTPEQLPPGMSKFEGIPHMSGKDGGHTINLHQFARDGVTLLGHFREASGTSMTFAPDLHETLNQIDGFELEVLGMIDQFVAEAGLDAPFEELPHLEDGFRQPIIEDLDLASAGITTVIWATGFGFDYSLVKLPVCDEDGFPIQQAGITSYPGLYFAGMPWMPSEKSGFLIGVGEAARHIAATIAARQNDDSAVQPALTTSVMQGNGPE